MFYWNQANFEGLKNVASAYEGKAGYEGFVEYCLKKEQGLKKQANSAIISFVEYVKTLPLVRQREIALEFAELHFYNSEIHQLLSHPLYSHIYTVLIDWSRENGATSEVFRWLATMGAGLSFYQRALEQDPNDQISIYKLGMAYIDDVDMQTHHLGESRLIGSIEELDVALSKAAELCHRLVNKEAKRALGQEIEYYTSLVNSWKEYTSQKQEKSFVEWCQNMGVKYNFPTIVYYQSK
ncbi:hypothetical protein [Zooshikella harenae]|uniref:Iron-containing redox enzyme family protein n=1 Tax=Zooshikella harenae TaxID=2827238 RepID=A0ABS5ZID4_9GAMM|nr:hypothetical protein [Zooshikella harenae]MBU2713828.1 hypothetical protein [Zooshikella harenae]